MPGIVGSLFKRRQSLRFYYQSKEEDIPIIRQGKIFANNQLQMMTIYTTWANAMGPLACLVEQKAIAIKFPRFRHVSTLSPSWSFEQQSRQVSTLPPRPMRQGCCPFGHALEAGWSGIDSIMEHQPF